MPYYKDCPKCGASHPTDNYRDYISDDELNYCYYCGANIEEELNWKEKKAEYIYCEKLDKTEEIKSSNKDIRCENNKIFLLSMDEYQKYRDVIPKCKTCWWLRTPCTHSSCASYVDIYGSVDYYGYDVSYDFGVRPALKSEIFKKVGETLVVNNFPFTCINKGLGIATVPISFDKFDSESNDYEKSYIKQWILDVFERIKSNHNTANQFVCCTGD